MQDIFEEYAKVMQDIKVPPMNLKLKKNRTICRMRLSVAVACCLAVILLFHSIYTPNYTLIVYAAGNSIELQQGESVFLSLENSLETDLIASSEGSNYFLYTFLFSIGCENAKSIKYVLKDEQTHEDIYHMYDSRLWFAEKEEVSPEEARTPTSNDQQYPYVYTEWKEEGTFYAYRYFGSEYSLLAADIENTPCRLAVKIEKGEDTYVFKDAIILVDIELQDGRVVQKELVLYLDEELSKKNSELCMAIREK